MFTGIIEELGTVVTLESLDTSAVLTILGPVTAPGARAGESICVNGVCLTVVASVGEQFMVDVMKQTLDLSDIGGLRPGDQVNLERAMPSDGRFGGHIVQGHVDGTTRIEAIEQGDNWQVMTLTLPAALERYLVPQGTITLDGVALTVASLGETTFTVALIPTTLALTTLGSKEIGGMVNVEVDVLAKYVERLLSFGVYQQGATA